MRKKIGVCFSRNFEEENPLGHIDKKLPVYLRFLDFCLRAGWDVFILTRKTYQGEGIFAGVWHYQNGKFYREKEKLKIDLVYDRSGGIRFPLEKDSLKVVNIRDFKILCWDKWRAFKEIGQFMPATFWVGDWQNAPKIFRQIKSNWIVLKPYNGLKGLGVSIGLKKDFVKFKPLLGRKYLAQEFIDTSAGVPGIAAGLHDIRIVIINGEVVWSHVRVPPKGSFKSNVVSGGILLEIDYRKVPESIKEIVNQISRKFYFQYDNSIYSLDFGIGRDGKPYIFEINDQIGFPRWEMKNRDIFLKALIRNFKQKIT